MDGYVLKSVMMIWVVAAVMITGTYAFFSDTETSSGNTIAAGVLNLKVGDADPYIETLVQIMDLTPGYTSYSNSIDLVINDNPGKVYKKISHLVCGNDITGHTLAKNTWFSLAVDNADIIPVETVSFYDISGQLIYLGTFNPGVPVGVVQGFTLTDCLFEWSDTELCTFTEEFIVLQTNEPHPIGCWNCGETP